MRKDSNISLMFDPAMDIMPPESTTVAAEPQTEPVREQVVEAPLTPAARLQKARAEIEAAKAQLCASLQSREDVLQAQHELLSFLGGKIAIAVEFPMAYASSVIPFKEFRVHLVYSDNESIYYASIEPRYWVSERGVVCAVRDNAKPVLTEDADIALVLTVTEIVERCEPKEAKLRVVDIPLGSWEQKLDHVSDEQSVVSTKTYSMPTRFQSVIALNAIGQLISTRKDDKGNEIVRFAAGMYANPEFIREFMLGDIKVFLT